jgi:3-dehydroquinate synthase
MERKMITKEEFEDIKQTIASFGFQVTLPGLITSEVLAAMGKDKKVDGNKIKFILLSGIGNAIIDTTVSTEEMTRAIEYIGGSER